MLALIVYDIPDNKRRTKLSKFLEGYGRRTQLSVFECFLTLDEMRHLHQLVEQRVKPEEDNVRFYWISSEAMTRANPGLSGNDNFKALPKREDTFFSTREPILDSVEILSIASLPWATVTLTLPGSQSWTQWK